MCIFLNKGPTRNFDAGITRLEKVFVEPNTEDLKVKRRVVKFDLSNERHLWLKLGKQSNIFIFFYYVIQKFIPCILD